MFAIERWLRGRITHLGDHGSGHVQVRWEGDHGHWMVRVSLAALAWSSMLVEAPVTEPFRAASWDLAGALAMLHPRVRGTCAVHQRDGYCGRSCPLSRLWDTVELGGGGTSTN